MSNQCTLWARAYFVLEKLTIPAAATAAPYARHSIFAPVFPQCHTRPCSCCERPVQRCSTPSRPDPSAAIGLWWKANRTYAENLLLDYTSPLAYATQRIPFDDDGYERLEDDSVNGVRVAKFRNDRATAWMDTEERDRPLRVTGDNRDILLSEWNTNFSADIPSSLLELNEVCSVAR